MARPRTGVTPVRNVRIEESLWRSAQQAARDQGETLTAVIDRALREYVGNWSADQEPATPER